MNASVAGRDSAPHARARTGAPASVEVIDATGRVGPAARDWLERQTRLAIEVLSGGGEVRVRVVDDAAMADLHGRFSQDPTTTDVLTFDLGAGTPGALDVDLYVCLDVAQRAASSRGHAPERELLLYVVHGLLHCLGHDDHDPERAAAMHRREDEVLTQLGVGTTYGVAERGGSSAGSAGEGR